ncbi:MAG TPA: COX15/CtaA family protein [Candidatus Dormibacteraeota bacterium]
MTRLTVLRWLAWVAAAGMFLVLVMGVTVTTTGSAEGCGRDWPLCHGRFVPDFAVATAIEFSHRAITAVEGVLIVVLAVLTAAWYWSRRPVRVLVPLMVLFLLLQAGLGAWAVKYPQLPVVLALHFGISLVALASTVLVAVYLGLLDAPAPAAVSRAVMAGAWGLAGYLYVLVYSGAYIRHVGAATGCASWPLCASPVNLLHRGLAGMALLLALGFVLLVSIVASARRDLLLGGWLLVGLILVQALAGAYLVWGGFSLIPELLHAAVTGLVFTAAANLCLRVSLGQPSRVRRQAVVGGLMAESVATGTRTS